MKEREAEKIIQGVGAAIAAGGSSIALPLSSLPCSLGRAKYAFLLMLEDLIGRGALTQEQGELLIGGFGQLSRFVCDNDAEIINAIRVKMGEKTASEKEIQDYMSFSRRARSRDLTFEINSYVNELYGKRDNQDVILEN